MTNKLQTPPVIEELQSVPVFGYELIRDVLLPDLLGKDTPEITYWAGKHLARKFPLLSFDEMISFFIDASWGTLTVINERKHELQLELSGDIVTRRMQLHEEPCFRLETGFIAQQIQSQKKALTEAFEEVQQRHKKVLITVRWDLKDPIDK
ncbi:YslB family protein [Bacillus sp. FJAT-50079]|uniref:YslB family protein n=1 Tax=Bacillus sp. FJAT-50079 TaxID=2833577 RepID=UPI001BCA4976|nr:YslB family protein [Bacillus sp. FJAT-50079]MBS4208847.1 YslB family protein [Bacillus sp. FJAT-50079]